MARPMGSMVQRKSSSQGADLLAVAILTAVEPSGSDWCRSRDEPGVFPDSRPGRGRLQLALGQADQGWHPCGASASTPVGAPWPRLSRATSGGPRPRLPGIRPASFAPPCLVAPADSGPDETLHPAAAID